MLASLPGSARVAAGCQQESSFDDAFIKVQLQQARGSRTLRREWVDHGSSKRKVIAPTLAAWVE